jgi:hypothetical protein
MPVFLIGVMSRASGVRAFPQFDFDRQERFLGYPIGCHGFTHQVHEIHSASGKLHKTSRQRSQGARLLGEPQVLLFPDAWLDDQAIRVNQRVDSRAEVTRTES